MMMDSEMCSISSSSYCSFNEQPIVSRDSLTANTSSFDNYEGDSDLDPLLIPSIDFDFPFDFNGFQENISNDSNLSLVQKQPPKRVYIKNHNTKHNIRRRANRVPRLIKRDLRRFYSIMYLNVINSGDDNMMIPYLNEYFSPDCLIQCTDHSRDELRQIDSHGISTFQAKMNLAHMKFPDLIFTMGDTPITNIYGIKDSDELIIKFPMRIMGTLVAIEIFQSLLSTMQELVKFVETRSSLHNIDFLELQPMNHDGEMTLVVNNCGQISRLSYIIHTARL